MLSNFWVNPRDVLIRPGEYSLEFFKDCNQFSLFFRAECETNLNFSRYISIEDVDLFSFFDDRGSFFMFFHFFNDFNIVFNISFGNKAIIRRRRVSTSKAVIEEAGTTARGGLGSLTDSKEDSKIGKGVTPLGLSTLGLEILDSDSLSELLSSNIGPSPTVKLMVFPLLPTLRQSA